MVAEFESVDEELKGVAKEKLRAAVILLARKIKDHNSDVKDSDSYMFVCQNSISIH